MNYDRYSKERHLLKNDTVHDRICHKNLDMDKVVDLLNRLERDRKFLKELKTEYKRVSRILDDFMEIANKMQANPKDDSARMIARDMLIMMGKEPKEEEIKWD